MHRGHEESQRDSSERTLRVLSTDPSMCVPTPAFLRFLPHRGSFLAPDSSLGSAPGGAGGFVRETNLLVGDCVSPYAPQRAGFDLRLRRGTQTITLFCALRRGGGHCGPEYCGGLRVPRTPAGWPSSAAAPRGCLFVGRTYLWGDYASPHAPSARAFARPKALDQKGAKGEMTHP